MTEVPQSDPQAVADYAFQLWENLDKHGQFPTAAIDVDEWRRLGLALWTLKERLAWLDLFGRSGGAS